jgi:hypothetical protein
VSHRCDPLENEFFSIRRSDPQTPWFHAGELGGVSLADMRNAINNVVANSSNSSNGVALPLPTQPSPTLMDVATKLDELIPALRR